ncbi:membrane protein insertion efficiency factor YidD [Rhodobacteraceae bacterium]|nr:membrane protein insertion efficiency factor YidD [Paracoccaceae bacterium]
MSPLAALLALPVRGYRLVFSPWVGHGCRYQPTCSAYMLDALRLHGGLRGGWMGIRRVLSCHPWGGFGYAPVPGADPEFDAQHRKTCCKEPPDA